MDPTDRPDLPGEDAAKSGPHAGHEESDVSIRGIVRFGVGLAVAAIAIHFAVWGVFKFFEGQEEKKDRPIPPLVAAGLARTPPEPRLEPNPVAARRRAQARENAALTSYGWVDRGSGVVRIPIERAMDLLVERGLPPSKPVAPATTPRAVNRESQMGNR